MRIHEDDFVPTATIWLNKLAQTDTFGLIPIAVTDSVLENEPPFGITGSNFGHFSRFLGDA
jgi:hypothetical protein